MPSFAAISEASIAQSTTTANAVGVISGVNSSSAVGTVTETHTTNHPSGDVAVTSSVGSVSGFGLAFTTLVDPSASISLGVIKPSLKKVVTGVAATHSVGSVEADTTEALVSVEAVATAAPLSLQTVVNKTLGSVSATSAANDLTNTALVIKRVSLPSAQLSLGTISTTAIQTAYSNTDFNPRSVVFLRKEDQSYTIYIR